MSDKVEGGEGGGLFMQKHSTAIPDHLPQVGDLSVKRLGPLV